MSDQDSRQRVLKNSAKPSAQRGRELLMNSIRALNQPAPVLPVADNARAQSVAKADTKRAAMACRFQGRISNPSDQSLEQLKKVAQDERVSYIVVGQLETFSYDK
jgi:hypothetical protein